MGRKRERGRAERTGRTASEKAEGVRVKKRKSGGT